jgi:catechol 2,3-dioxygenase-like lactoylglutathione lyase family enzyme
MIEGMDHIALGAKSFDDRVAFFMGALGMKLKRTGVDYATGKRIALLADDKGFKIELIEAPSESQTLRRVAFRVSDARFEYERLVTSGCVSIRPPHELAAAKAVTALVQDPSGLQIQVIQYDPDSPDL